MCVNFTVTLCHYKLPLVGQYRLFRADLCSYIHKKVVIDIHLFSVDPTVHYCINVFIHMASDCALQSSSPPAV